MKKRYKDDKSVNKYLITKNITKILEPVTKAVEIPTLETITINPAQAGLHKMKQKKISHLL